MLDYLRALLRRGVFSEDENIRRIAIMDMLFGFVAGMMVVAQIYFSVLG